MDTDSVFIEAAFALGRHSGECTLTPDAAGMFARVLHLTVGAGLASSVEAWESRETGRAYVLHVVARIAEEAARLAGKGKEISADVIRTASTRIIRQERKRLGMPDPDRSELVLSKFCFAYAMSELYVER